MSRPRLGALVGAGVLALVALVALRIALGKSLGDWVAAEERARFEREVGPLDPARLESPAVDEAENAATAIAAAVAALELGDDARARLAVWERGDAASAAEVDGLLARLAPPLAAIADAARRPRSSFGPRRELFHGAPIDFAAWLTAARLLRADGERGLALGDAARGAAALDGLFGMALALRREPLALFAVTGAAAEYLWLDLVRLHVARGVPVPGDPAAGLDRLAGLPDAFAVMRGEAVFGHDMLRRTPFVPRRAASARERIEALLWPWSEGHVEAGYLAGWRELATLARRPQSEWPPIERIATDDGRLRRWIDPTVPYETVRAMLVPNLLSIARKLQLLAASEQLAGLALAVAAARDAAGELPAALAGFPGAATPDPASASLPVYTLVGDGGVVELPAARELLDSWPPDSAGARRRERLLRWEIAATHER